MRRTCLANCPNRVWPRYGFCTEHWPLLTEKEQQRITRPQSKIARHGAQVAANAARRRREAR